MRVATRQKDRVGLNGFTILLELIPEFKEDHVLIDSMTYDEDPDFQSLRLRADQQQQDAINFYVNSHLGGYSILEADISRKQKGFVVVKAMIT